MKKRDRKGVTVTVLSLLTYRYPQWMHERYTDTYRVGFVTRKDIPEPRLLILERRELFRIHRRSIPSHTDNTERQIRPIRRRQLVLSLQILIQCLTDGTVSPVGSDNNVGGVD